MTPASSAGRYEFKPGPFSSHGRILRAAEAWPRTSRILEIGTASGYLGRELLRRGFTEVVGVECDPAAAARARDGYQQHLVLDLERQTLPDHLGTFDVLICADVLEHLRDPPLQLRALKRSLKPRGLLVVSLPNIANWTNRLSLLVGRFTYRDRGLLDRGHLHFFTYRAARELIEGAGFAIARCDPTPIPIAYILKSHVPAVFAGWLEAAYFALTIAWRRLFAYQFVFVADATDAN